MPGLAHPYNFKQQKNSLTFLYKDTYLNRRVYPECWVEEYVVKQMFEEWSTIGKIHQVLGQLQETWQYLVGHMLTGRLKYT